MKKSTKIILIVAGALAIIPIGRTVYQRIDHQRLLHALKEERVQTIPAKRGDIYDCEGNLIATSEPFYEIRLDCMTIESPELWEEKTLALAPKLAAMLPERTATEWWAYLQDGREKEKRYLKIAKDVTPQKKDSIAKLPLFDMPSLVGGAIYERYDKRCYPYDSLARRAIGYVRGGKKRVGVEARYDSLLRGQDGSKTIRSGWYKGKRQHLVTRHIEPEGGADAMITLSMPMQALADSALRAGIGEDMDIASGCVVVMEVATGAIRAMVNLSRGTMPYDSDRLWERYNDAIAHSYEPGEVLQTMTLASVFRDGHLHSLSTKMPTSHGIIPYMSQDARLTNYERQFKTDSISVLDAFAISSHYGMARLATDAYEESTKYYATGLRHLCLPAKTDIGIEGLGEVDITNPEGVYWNDSTLSCMANGKCISMVPMDILSFYNTIANKGQMVQPYLLEKAWTGSDTLFCHNHNGNILKVDILSSSVADSLARALVAVTESGTGARLRDARYPVAGKTGTARQVLRVSTDETGHPLDPYCDEEGRFQTAATYAGFFPAESPRYSIICVLYSRPCNKTYFGGTLPALIVKDIVDGIEL